MFMEICDNAELLRQFLELYTSAFPPEERRQYRDVGELQAFIQSRSPLFRIIVKTEPDAGAILGFLTWWDFPQYAYVEHFAVRPDMRGAGLGTEMLAHLRSTTDKGILLEVERPEKGEIARRRIAFYERNGFEQHPEIEYIQPPYSPGMSEVPLLLMTAGNITLNASALDTLRHYVYCR